MDIFAHMLWTNVAFYKKYTLDLKDRLWAVFFGVMPDLVSFTPVTIYTLFFSRSRFNPQAYLTSTNWVYFWARESYKATHSLVVFATVFLIVLAIRKGKLYWPLLGWALHVMIDIFTHPDFYRTPFLYPISNFKNSHAISWGDPTFMLINYSLIALSYIFIFYLYKKRNAKKK